ncbi:Ig-like domain-containing protein [Deinococcus oregonensis]|uniref:Ig-like domain-containing protein n=1 Tax=Deinococcus oregonensis TaxID=1805970 RepID=A0ABV6B0U1_9DEIO
MKKILTASTLLLTALLSACTTGGTTPTLSIKAIELTPASASVQIGKTVTLSATARDEQGRAIPNVGFTWKSSQEAVAKVVGGVVTGLSAGTAGVTASASGVISNAANVIVTQNQPQPGGSFDLTLSGDKLPVITGTSASLTVNVTRRDGFTGAVTLNLTGLPIGASGAAITIPEGQASAAVTVSAAMTAPHSQPTAVTLKGTGTGVADVSKTITVTVRGPAGSLDTTFGVGGVAVNAIGASEDYSYALAVQPDGKVLMAGTAFASSDDFAVVRYTRDGALDPTFGNGGKVFVDFAGKSDLARALAIQGDGKIVVAGNMTNAANEERFGVARLTSTGALDPTFGEGGRVMTSIPGSSADRAQALLVEADGRVVVGGSASFASGATGQDFALVRYRENGTLDAGFGSGGVVTTALGSSNAKDTVRALAAQGDRIVAVGGDGDFKAARYTSGGLLDASFGSGGKLSAVFAGSIGVANAVAVDALGRLVLAGNSENDTAVVRLDADGALDTTFGSGGKQVVRLSENWDSATGVAVQADGKLVLGGWVYEGNSSAGNFAVTRLEASGARDAGFGQGGTSMTPVAPGSKADEAQALALQPDERIPATRIVLGGHRNDSNNDFALTRYWP